MHTTKDQPPLPLPSRSPRAALFFIRANRRLDLPNDVRDGRADGARGGCRAEGAGRAEAACAADGVVKLLRRGRGCGRGRG